MSYRMVKAVARLLLRESASRLRRSADHWCRPVQAFPRLTVGRVTVRPLQLSDMEAWEAARLANEERMRPWWPAVTDWRKGNDDAVFLRYYLGWRASARRGQAYPLAIVGPDGLLGEITLWRMSRVDSTAEVGIWTRPDAVAGEELMAAFGAALDYLVFNLGFERLDAPVAHANPYPVRALVWFGFEHEGVLSHWRMVGDQLADHDMYGITRERWLVRRPEIYCVNPWPLSSRAPAMA
jgi:[ribosomal protein S5]-alanine N-acetyltransferase